MAQIFLRLRKQNQMILFEFQNFILKVLARHLDQIEIRGNSGGIIFYICSYIIASELTSFTFPNDIDAFFIEINLTSNKGLICCSHNPKRTVVSTHSNLIAKGTNTYSKKYQKKLMGYFNVPFTEANMAAFWMNTKFRL